jgi:transposase
VPAQYSTGGKNDLLGISKRGDKNLRRLLMQCARAYATAGTAIRAAGTWVGTMLTRRHSNVVACASANNTARIVWAIAAHHARFNLKEAQANAGMRASLGSL